MCIQRYTECRYNLCHNAVQILDFVECSRKPCCETELVRMPLKQNSDKFHCDDCAKNSPRERNLLYKSRHELKKLQRMQRSQDTRMSPNKANEDERIDPDPTVTAMLREQINATQSLPPQQAAIVPANNQSHESEHKKMEVALELLALAQKIGMASNESQNEEAIAPIDHQSDESDEKKLRAALTLLALAEIIGKTPNVPQSEAVITDQERMDTALTTVAPSQQTPNVPQSEAAIAEQERMDTALTTVAPSQQTPNVPQSEAAIAEQERMDTALTTVAPSQQTPTMPPNDAQPDPSLSTESEDEAYDAALILLEMARGPEQAPDPSRPGPKMARFQHPPRRLRPRYRSRSHPVQQASQLAMVPYCLASRVTKR